MLEINNISKRFTDKVALENVSFSIPSGSIYGLLGQNGAGKTTLIRILNQIYEPSSGTIKFDGEKLNTEHIKNIGYLPEERGLYKKIKVLDHLIYFAKLRGYDTKMAELKANYWLEKVKLSDVKNKRTEELSKGMQQKIQFIMAVLHEPKFLILDEPFSGLDPINAELLIDIIKELNEKGVTILFSTHRMDQVEKLCSHIAIIHQSKLIVDGKVSDIKKTYTLPRIRVKTQDYLILKDNALKFISQDASISETVETILEYPPQIMNYKMVFNILANDQEILKFEQYVPSVSELFFQLINNN